MRIINLRYDMGRKYTKYTQWVIGVTKREQTGKFPDLIEKMIWAKRPSSLTVSLLSQVSFSAPIPSISLTSKSLLFQRSE